MKTMMWASLALAALFFMFGALPMALISLLFAAIWAAGAFDNE